MTSILPITGCLGAEVEGVNLGVELDAGIVEELKRGLLDHKVLVFHNQAAFTPDLHAKFAAHFATLGLTVTPFHPSIPGHPEVNVLKTNGTEITESWHTDLGFDENPNIVTVLQAIEIPPYGRDTMFASTEAAYDGLSSVMQRMLKDLTAVRDWRHIFGAGGVYGRNASKETIAKADAEMPAITYPLIATNADTGRLGINVDRTFTTHIPGMRPEESTWLLRFLYDQMHVPEYQLRVRWKKFSVVIWDNRTTQHALVFDKGYARVMHRVIGKGRSLFPLQDSGHATAAPGRRTA